jgi:hypothetical protein
MNFRCCFSRLISARCVCQPLLTMMVLRNLLSDVDAGIAVIKCPTPAPPGSCKSKQDFESAVTSTSGTLPKSDEVDDYYVDSNDGDSKPQVHGT